MNMLDFSPPADDASVVSVMKWMIAVMDNDDSSLHFIASVLSHCCKYGGITERQADAVEGVYSRLLNAFETGALNIQGGCVGISEGPANVVTLRPRGAA